MTHSNSKYKEGDLVYVPAEVTLWSTGTGEPQQHPTDFRKIKKPTWGLYLGSTTFMRREFAKVLIEGQTWFISPSALFRFRKEDTHGDS